jgi:hypothetical protein
MPHSSSGSASPDPQNGENLCGRDLNGAEDRLSAFRTRISDFAALFAFRISNPALLNVRHRIGMLKRLRSRARDATRRLAIVPLHFAGNRLRSEPSNSFRISPAPPAQENFWALRDVSLRS